MKKYFLLVCSVLLSIQVYANDSFNSEASHFIGGAIMAGGITATVDYVYPKYSQERAMIGFGISSLTIIVEQTVEYIQHGDARGQILDAVSHIAGSALGAYITDSYILSPVIKNSPNGEKFTGLQVTHSF